MSNLVKKQKLTSRSYIELGIVGMILIVSIVTFVLFGVELDSAAIAKGRVNVEGNRKLIEHLEGGIVDNVLIKEGQKVNAGDQLIQLSANSIQTQVTQLEFRLLSIQAQRERLESERRNRDTLNFSDALKNKVEQYPNLIGILETQKLLFLSRSELHNSEQAVLKARFQRVESQEAMLVQQIETKQRAYELLLQEFRMHDRLLEKGHSSRLKAIELKRKLNTISGDLIRIKGQKKDTHLSKLEVSQQQSANRNRFITEVEKELQDLNRVVEELSEELSRVKEILSRTSIRSPYSGKILGLKVFSKGDVISPGETLMQIVPEDGRMIIKANLHPDYIDEVVPGQKSMVRLLSYNPRSVPMIEGEVVHIGADRLESSDLSSGELSGYEIKVVLNADEIAAHPQIGLYPGMPAEVYITLRKRTPFEYLIEPISIGLMRSMKR